MCPAGSCVSREDVLIDFTVWQITATASMKYYVKVKGVTKMPFI